LDGDSTVSPGLLPVCWRSWATIGQLASEPVAAPAGAAAAADRQAVTTTLAVNGAQRRRDMRAEGTDVNLPPLWTDMANRE